MSDDDQHPKTVRDAPSKASGGAAVSEVSDLMDERRRLEAWLAALEARRDSTPERVYTRVHADYSVRLDVVISQLVNHTDGLRGELARLTAQLASMRDAQQQAREERAESELRAQVGELAAPDWEKLKASIDTRIADLNGRFADLQQEMDRTRELLVDAERPSTSGSSKAAISAAPATDGSRGAAPDAGGKEAGVSTNRRTASFDELAFLSSVVDSGTKGDSTVPADATPSAPTRLATPTVLPARATPALPAAATPAVPAAATPAAPVKSTPALRHIEKVTSPPRQLARADPPAAPTTSRRDSVPASDRIENLDGAPGAVIGSRTGGSAPLAANISGNNPVIIKDKGSQSDKTLKCAECSAMNSPTEWYCERCGAELASL